MGFILIWLENLAVALLLVAVLMACAARPPKGGVRVLVMTLAIVVPLLFYILLTLADWQIEFQRQVRLGWFWPLASLTAAFLLGAIAVERRAARRVDDGGMAASTWPLAKLALALAVVAIVHVMTFLNLDEAARLNLVNVRSEAAARSLFLAPPRLDDRDNAAVLYLKVFAALGGERVPRAPEPEVWDKAITDVAERSSSGTKTETDFSAPELDTLLRERAAAVAMLHEAAKLPGCYFDHNYAHPSFDMLLPETQEMRNCCYLLAIHARHAQAKGDLGAALNDVNSIYALSRHASTEPILVTLLVAEAIDYVADCTLQDLLLSTTAAKPTLEQLQMVRWPDVTSFRRLMRRTMLMEEAFALGVFADLEGFDPDVPIEYVLNDINPQVLGNAAPFYRVFLLDSDLGAYRQFMHSASLALESASYAACRSKADKLDEFLKTIRPGIVSGLLAPGVLPMARAGYLGDARHAVARVGMAMHVYRAQHGRFADKLDDLVPGAIDLLPPDPFNGGPLRLAIHAKGWVVYSVGPDQEDHGGRPMDKALARGDVTFEYVEAPAEKPETPAEKPATPAEKPTQEPAAPQ